jgi:hypothetical protein
MKLEIGGMRKMEGWLSIDNREMPFNIISHELPLDDHSLEYVYMSHVIEHIPVACSKSIFSKIYKKLKLGGKLRVVCPDLEIILNAYIKNDMSIFNNKEYQLGTVPKEYMDLGIGGCVISQITTGVVGDDNDSYLFTKRTNGDYICTFSHISGWDYNMIFNLLSNIGFINISKTELEDIDPHQLKGQLCVNAYK